MDKFSIYLNQKSALKLAAVPVIVMTIFNYVGMFVPDLVVGIDMTVLQQELEKTVNAIMVLTASLSYIFGVVSNLIKNFSVLKNGISIFPQKADIFITLLKVFGSKTNLFSIA